MSTTPVAVVPLALAAFLEAFDHQCREHGIAPSLQEEARTLFVETVASQTAAGLAEYRGALLVDGGRDAFTDVAEDFVDSWLYLVRLKARVELKARRVQELAAQIAALDAELARLRAATTADAPRIAAPDGCGYGGDEGAL